MRPLLVMVQGGTCASLGVLLLLAGHLRLGVAQLLFAVTTGLVYW